MLRIHLPFACSLALLAAPAEAQAPYTSRALGMGGAFIGVARGVEAPYQNPANLALPDNPRWSFAFPQLSLTDHAHGFDRGAPDDLERFGWLTEGRRREILDDVPESGARYDGSLRIPTITYQNGRFAAGMSAVSLWSGTVDRGAVDLLLNGFDPRRAGEYEVGGTGTASASYLDVYAAMARRAGPVSIGVTAHVYPVGSMSREGFVEQETSYDGDGAPDDLRSTWAGVHVLGMTGFGLDVGIAAQPARGLTVGAALDNAVSALRWSEDVYLQSVTLDRAAYATGDADSLRSAFEGSEARLALAQPTDPEVLALVRGLRDDRSTGLPPTLRLGAAYEPGRGTTLGAAFQSELRDSPLSRGWRNQMSAGIQQRIPSVASVRAGVATNLDGASLLSFGATVWSAHLDFASVRGDEETDGIVGSFSLVVTPDFARKWSRTLRLH